jgi:hypothetical protein
MATNGTDAPGCGITNNPCASLEYSVSQCSNVCSVLLMPGHYTLSHIEITNRDLTVTSASTSIVSVDTRALITPFCSVYNSTFTIENLYISETSSLFITGSASSLNIRNCLFENYDIQIINVTDSTIEIFSTQFYYNTEVQIASTNMIGCEQCDKVNLTLVDIVNVQLTTGVRIGSILRITGIDQGQSQVVLQNCLFQNISIDSSTDSYSGSIFISSMDQVLFDNVQFENITVVVNANSRKLIFGLAMTLSEINTLQITNTSVSSLLLRSIDSLASKECVVEGGGIFILNTGQITIDYCLFQNNMVYSTNSASGLIYVLGNTVTTSFSLTNSVLHGNQLFVENGDANGGALALNMETQSSWLSPPSVVIFNCSISENTIFPRYSASGRGGALFISTKSGVSISYCDIRDNSITFPDTYSNSEMVSKGGALYVSVYSNSGTHIESVVFASNSIRGVASSGGALYAEYSLQISSSIFQNNSIQTNVIKPIKIQGGAICCVICSMTIHSCTFEDNSLVDYNAADSKGGSMYVDGYIVPAENCSFSRNYVYSANGTAAGGALYLISSSDTPNSFNSSQFVNNSVSVEM